ncbi:MAG: FHA domain-containing protein [Armatimonadetes bacterium]|nr:FHA domain-containing protein [Armatimonadota bacterium]MBS1702834.1 FHA domain-containing protein [Armatimonadota bacterium]MBS1727931.1 FHA domain-containing protein [Armatimonadota bacterium]
MTDDTQVAEPIEDLATDSVEATEDQAAAAEPGVLKPILIVKRNGAETDEVFIVNNPCVIGRFDPTVGPIDIDLGSMPEGVYVSRKHAKIFEDGGVWKIADLGSSNGTFILTNDFEKVDEAELSDGIEIALGNARFIFRLS